MDMEKITANHPLSQSTDIIKQNVETLKKLFPTIVKEGRIDMEELKALLGEELENSEEYYRFTWAGKSHARQEANKPSTGTLRPAREESKDWDTTQNIFIEGDNLEVLKLLQKSYSNKIKMIYIDPPYNTGNDFVYKDDYADNLGNYLNITGQTDKEGRKLSTNTETDGRYHSNWLNMMYPRLKLARNLLRDDGAIFISIDDNEVDNLKKLCNEIFGEENFIANIIWQHSIQPKGYLRKFSVHHNYTLCFQKSNFFELQALERTEEHNMNYSNPDNDPNGLWRPGDVRNALYRRNLIYDIITPFGKTIAPPSNGWRWSKETVLKKIETGEIIFNADETKIIRKIYLSKLEGRTPETIWFGKEVGTTRDAARELKNLFENTLPFDTPKPSTLIQKLITIATADPSSIIIDFFAGSGTTAHAVMQLNADDGGNRKFICVQLPEPTAPDSEAYKAGKKTISEITKERIRRAGEKVKSEIKEDLFNQGNKTLDIGFRVFKLDSSNINAWDGNMQNFEQSLLSAAENIKADRTEEDVLYEILLKSGLDLAQPIEEKTIADKKVFNIGLGALALRCY